MTKLVVDEVDVDKLIKQIKQIKKKKREAKVNDVI